MMENGERLIDQVENSEESKAWAREWTEAQTNEIENQVKEQQPLVAEKQGMEALIGLYNETDSVDFLHKAQDLAKNYQGIRFIRGDGNCFYRAVAFAKLERLFSDKAECQKFLSLVKGWRDRLLKLGFPEFTTGDFCDWYEELVEGIQTGSLSEGKFFEQFNEDGPSNYYVVFMRLITSGYLQENKEQFEGFIADGKTVEEFCKTEVDPMWKDCDHVCITGLIQALDIPIRIEYMDRTLGPSGGWHHDFLADRDPEVVFLYRPGHYDILYKA